MTSKSPWRIEAITVDPQTNEIGDWVMLNPGPEMRGWLSGRFKPGVAPRDLVMLSVIYLPTGRGLRARIIRDKKRFRAHHNGQLHTLEAATKMMKEDLLHGRK